MKFLTPTKHTKELIPSLVSIDPAVLSGVCDTPATTSSTYGRGVDPRHVIYHYEEALRNKIVTPNEKRGIGVFIITETLNFVFSTINEADNLFFSLDLLLDNMETYTSEYYPPVVLIEKPIPQNPPLNLATGVIAGAIYLNFLTKPIWCNPINWRGKEKAYFKRFLDYYGVEADIRQFSPHEIDACLLYAYLFDGYRPKGGMQ